MTVFTPWSPPRARSTVFFRSMLERGDLLGVHEPFCYLTCYGEVEVAGTTMRTPSEVIAWLRDAEQDVFLKDTTDYRYPEVLTDRDFLATARHAFLIRRPDEIAASFHAIQPQPTENSIGLEALHELYELVGDAGGQRVVIDSDDLVAEPPRTMASYCAEVGLPSCPTH